MKVYLAARMFDVKEVKKIVERRQTIEQLQIGFSKVSKIGDCDRERSVLKY